MLKYQQVTLYNEICFKIIEERAIGERGCQWHGNGHKYVRNGTHTHTHIQEIGMAW